MLSDLEELAKEIRNCKKCPLWETRNKPVPGEGPTDAKVILIGEAPGAKEDLAGKPFVGLSGKFLTEALQKFDLSRKDFFITGVLKCRPPKNRTPRKSEIKACLPYTLKQIEIIDPKIVCLMGGVAIESLLGKEFSVSKDSGKIIEKGETYIYILMPHPAAAMRFPKMKKLFRKGLGLLKLELESK